MSSTGSFIDLRKVVLDPVPGTLTHDMRRALALGVLHMKGRKNLVGRPIRFTIEHQFNGIEPTVRRGLLALFNARVQPPGRTTSLNSDRYTTSWVPPDA